jgi:PKD repeat protein
MSTLRNYCQNLVLLTFLGLQVLSTNSSACNSPSNLRVVAYGTNSITIAWSGTTAPSFQLRYVLQGGNFNSAPIITITSNPYTITGLNVNTSYAVQVRELCSPGANPWPSFILGSTSCAVQNAPFTSNFNGGAWTAGSLNTPGSINSCWQRTSTSLSVTWKPGPPAFISNLSGPSTSRSGSGKYMQIARSGFFFSTVPDSALFESPLVDLGALTNPQLKFWYHMFGQSIDELTVYISNDFGQTYTLLQTLSGQQQFTGTDSWIESPLNLSAYANDTVRIRFKYYQAVNGFQNAVSIDDFTIEEAPNCPRPTQFSNTFTTSTEAFFNWTSGGATNWQISYGPVGFSANAGTIVNINSNPSKLSGLSPNTTYEAYIRDSCGLSDVSVWTGPISFKTKCNPVSTPYIENFDGSGFSSAVGFNGIGNINSCWSRSPLTPYVWATGPPQFTPTTTGPQGDHTTGSANYLFTESIGFGSNSPNAELESPLINLVGLTNPQLSFYLHSYGSGISDLKTYVNNGSGWVLLNTQTGQQQNSKAANWKEIIISLASYVNDTISIRFSGAKTGNSNLADIAIDDINIDEAPSCPRPQNLALLGLTSSSADLQWLSGGANNWNLSYGSPGFSVNSGTIVNASSNPETINGLISNTTYEVYVRDSCAVGDVSLWTGPISFQTACTPITAPYFENFDGSAWIPSNFTSTGSIDACWNRAGSPTYFVAPYQGATSIAATGPSGDKTSGSGKYIYSQRQGFGGGDLFAEIISPQIDLSSLGSPELRFWYHMFGADVDKIEVAVSTGGSYSTLNTISGQQQNTASAAWLERVVNLNSYLNDTISVRFRIYRNSTFSFFAESALDDFRVDNSPTCPSPSILTINTNTTSSINISWTSGGAANWQIRYRPAGSATPFTIASVNSNPFTINGLNSSTNYEIFVRDSCAVGNVSFWEGPAFGQTSCGVSSIPYSEDFDDNTWLEGSFGINFGDQVNSCWNRPSNTDNNRWGTRTNNPSTSNGPSVDASGSGKYINWESASGSATLGTISSPQIAIINSSSPYLYFKYHMFGSGINNLQVRLNTQSNGNNITIKTISGQQQTSKASAWLEDSVDLSSYIGDTIVVIFRAQALNFLGDIAVDELRIENIGPSCGAPINLNLVSATHTSLDFSWQTTNTGATTHLRWYSATAGSTAASFVPNVTSPFSLSGLNPSTDYVIELFDSCTVLVSNSLADTLSTLICDTVNADFTFNGRFLRRSFQSTASNADSLFWQFGSLDSSYVLNPNYNFPVAGVYSITLIAYNSCGNSDTIVKSITICDTLRANFTNTFFNDSTRFFANLSNNASGYSWDLDVGLTATGDSVAVKYSDADAKIVTLTSWNACGDTVRNTRNIPGCEPPVANWTYSILSPINTGLRVQFDASSSSNGSAYYWDFGDGNTGTGINPIHVFSTPNLLYKVKLTVTNSCGGQDFKEFRLNQIGIAEETLLNSVTIYPNPAKDLLYIKYDSQNIELEDIRIYNMQGKLVLQKKLESGDLLTVDVESLSAGFYQVVIKSEFGYLKEKLIIN